MTRIKVMVAGDVHIGRVSSRVSNADSAEVSARRVWDRLVDVAVEEAVDLLCLTGDIADESNRFWEAIGPLERGLNRLKQHGVVTLGVSGNHDYDVLPRLADQLDAAAFRLLGRDGTWKRFTLRKDGEALLHIDGWSFPRERVRSSPVDSYNVSEDATAPTLVMVHGDLDVPDSPYAPLPRQQMLAKPVAGWLLGHIHAPMVAQPDGQPFIVYPGSPQALDPGETGVHGVCIVEFEHGRCAGIRALPISTVRYDSLRIDISGVSELSELTTRVRTEIEAFAERAAKEGADRLRHLVLRLTLSGQTALAGELKTEADQIRDDFELTAAGVACGVDRVTLRVLPVVDLEGLSRASTPPGMLAALLIELRDGKPLDQLTDRSQRLTAHVKAATAAQRGAPIFDGIGDGDALDDGVVREAVGQQAEALLIELLQQQDKR